MRRSIIFILLLATVVLSTGVVLPRLKPLQPGPDPVDDESKDRPTKCEVLRKLYKANNGFPGPNGEIVNWETFNFDEDNKEDSYNENVSKRRDWGATTLDDSWLSYSKQFSHRREYERDFHQPKSYAHGEIKYEKPDNDVEIVYGRNKDVLIRDDNAYYVYDTYMATTSPFDYLKNKYNCLYKPMSRPLYDLPPDTHYIDIPAESKAVYLNAAPEATQVVGKRVDASDEGEKEIPDNLEFNDGDNDVEKKLFSFWSRLQALSHKGRQLPTRRHTFVYYGNDGTRDGALSAETRASRIRPPGQPLRWG